MAPPFVKSTSPLTSLVGAGALSPSGKSDPASNLREFNSYQVPFDPTKFSYQKPQAPIAYAALDPRYSPDRHSQLEARILEYVARKKNPLHVVKEEPEFDHEAHDRKKAWNEGVTVVERMAQSGVVGTLEAEGMRRQRMNADGVDQNPFYNPGGTDKPIDGIDWQQDGYGEIFYQILMQARHSFMEMMGALVIGATGTEVEYPEFFDNKELVKMYDKSGDNYFSSANGLDIFLGYLFSKMHLGTDGIMAEIQDTANKYFNKEKQEAIKSDIEHINEKKGTDYYLSFLKFWGTHGPVLRAHKTGEFISYMVRLGWVVSFVNSSAELLKSKDRIQHRRDFPEEYFIPDEYLEWLLLPFIIATEDNVKGKAYARAEQLRLGGILLTTGPVANGSTEDSLGSTNSEKSFWTLVKSSSKTAATPIYHSWGPAVAFPLLGLVHFATLRRFWAIKSSYPAKLLRILGKPKYSAQFRSYLNSLGVYAGQAVQSIWTGFVFSGLMYSYFFSGADTLGGAYDELLQAGENMPWELGAVVTVIMTAPQMVCATKDYRTMIASARTFVSKIGTDAPEDAPDESEIDAWNRFVRKFGYWESSTEEELGEMAAPMNDMIGATSASFALTAAPFMANLQLMPLGYLLNAVSSVLDVTQTVHKKAILNLTLRRASAGLFNRTVGRLF